VINVFQLNYETRLKNWYDLRQQLQNTEDATKCVEIDKWWQSAPIVTHHLHPQDIDNWPDPWELLSENTYCEVARALGMCYTLLLIGITDIELVLARNDTAEDVVLVLVNNAKYIMNYWPDTVISNTLKDFKVVQKLDLQTIIKKIGRT
jgi:hypothetical protein